MPSVLRKSTLDLGPSITAATSVGLISAMPTPATPPKAGRIPALDFTKGALVLIMVLYHWMNYFLNLSWTYYKYLHFLTPSFIFITGFMVSNIYLSKYAAADPRLSKRLFSRGLKLLAIFIILNLARNFVIPVLGTGSPTRNPLNAGNVFAVFVTGNVPVAGGKLVAFPILVPISYLLMFSGALMLPYRFYKRTFHVICVLLLLSIWILGLTGAQSPNLECIAIGMLGVLTGFVPIEAINNFVRHPYILAFVYLCYTIAITIWNVPFPLLIVGVLLSLMVIYLLGASRSEFGTIRSEFILLGKYSLFGYISQIAILQILAAGFRHANLGVAGLGVSFFAALALTMVSVEVADRARARAGIIDRWYKAVFA
jgi:peptidoglycan/LPS O-acetylase OafA/YrhL